MSEVKTISRAAILRVIKILNKETDLLKKIGEGKVPVVGKGTKVDELQENYKRIMLKLDEEKLIDETPEEAIDFWEENLDHFVEPAPPEEVEEEKETPKKKEKGKEKPAEKKSKKTETEPKKPGVGKKKVDYSKSNKAVVYKAWKDGETNFDTLHKKVNKAVKLGTIKGWLAMWGRGKGLPAVASRESE